MGLSILTFIVSIFVYIGDFFYSLFTGMSKYFVGLISSAVYLILSQYASDLSGWGIFAPLLFIITIAVGGILSLAILSAGKVVEDFE